MTFFAACARYRWMYNSIVDRDIPIYCNNIGIRYMVAGGECGPNCVPSKGAPLHPFFNKSRSNADHSRLIYIHVKTSIECTTIIHQVLFGLFADYLSHDWPADLYPYNHVCFTNTCVTGKEVQQRYYWNRESNWDCKYFIYRFLSQ